MNFNKLPYKYWSIKKRISCLQRQIIVHSIIYYELDSNVITDKEFDMLSKLLVGLQQNKNEFKKSEYYYCMYDFDGSTGFFIYDRLNEHDKKYLRTIAISVLKNYKRGKKNDKNGSKQKP